MDHDEPTADPAPDTPTPPAIPDATIPEAPATADEAPDLGADDPDAAPESLDDRADAGTDVLDTDPVDRLAVDTGADIAVPSPAAEPGGATADHGDAGPDTGDAAGGPVAALPAWRRIGAGLMRPRLTAAGAIIALLVGLLGFGLIAQVKSNANESTLANDRPDDLVRILSDLDARKDRLSTEISNLQETVRQLTSGAQGRQAALDAAAQRADELGILAGTLPAEGPGLVVTLQPTTGKQLDASAVLNAVEELRGAGAEAMSISTADGAGVRVVASTYFTDGAAGVIIDGQTLPGALLISVIGDAQTMQTAMSIPGGVVDTVRGDGGTVLIEAPTTVRVTLLHPTGPLRYAHAVS